MKINKEKIMTKIFKGTFIILFIIFLVLYFSESSGYYEFKNARTKELTDKQISKFENDIANGKEVDIEDYIVTKDKNYHNKLSKAGLSLSNTVSNLIQKGLNNTFSAVSKLIEE